MTSPFLEWISISRFIQAWGNLCLTAQAKAVGVRFEVLPASGEVVCHIPELPLAPGKYAFNLFLTVGGGIVDWVQQAGYLDVVAGDYFGTGQLRTHREGFLVKHKWSVKAPC